MNVAARVSVRQKTKKRGCLRFFRRCGPSGMMLRSLHTGQIRLSLRSVPAYNRESQNLRLAANTCCCIGFSGTLRVRVWPCEQQAKWYRMASSKCGILCARFACVTVLACSGQPPSNSCTADNASGASSLGPCTGGTAATGGATSQRTLAQNSLAVRFANAVLSRWPDPATVASSLSAWDYNHGIVLRGIEQVYRYTSDSRYLAYIQKYADEFVSASGAIDIPAAHSFDNIEPSVLLPFLYAQTGLARYQTASDTVRARYDTIPRNADNGFWHKQTYPNQMWLDSIYMGEPFLARYGAVFGTCGSFCGDTVIQQTTLIAQHVQDPATGLLYHAWDDSPAGSKVAWADPTSGRSPVIWDRAMGWFAMSLVDTLDDLPSTQTGRSDMLALVTSTANAIKNTQDAATGLWYQVVDQASRSDDWLETSGSGMFVYFLKVAVARGYIDESYLTVANAGWQGLQTQVTTDGSGLPTINGAVQGMGVQTSYAGYVNQARLSNSSHGLCAILLAASEMEAQ